MYPVLYPCGFWNLNLSKLNISENSLEFDFANDFSKFSYELFKSDFVQTDSLTF